MISRQMSLSGTGASSPFLATRTPPLQCLLLSGLFDRGLRPSFICSLALADCISEGKLLLAYPASTVCSQLQWLKVRATFSEDFWFALLQIYRTQVSNNSQSKSDVIIVCLWEIVEVRFVPGKTIRTFLLFFDIRRRCEEVRHFRLKLN